MQTKHRARGSSALVAVAFIVASGMAAAAETPPASGPAFSCKDVRSGSIEALICADQELSALDRKLAQVYQSAAAKAKSQQRDTLRVEQRGWIKGRNDCWKSDDRKQCVREEYVRRIAELQATYRLVAARGPFTFVCNEATNDRVVATYFETDPGTLLAQRGDSTSLMYQQPAASGARYQGRNESLWEHQGEARVVWGFEAPEMVCKLRR